MQFRCGARWTGDGRPIPKIVPDKGLVSSVIGTIAFGLCSCSNVKQEPQINVFEGQWLGTYKSDSDHFARATQVAFQFSKDGNFELRDLSSLGLVKGRFSYEERPNTIFLFIENNPTAALDLREQTTLVSSYEFYSPHILTVKTDERLYELGRSSVRLGLYGLDGHWYCPQESETWYLYAYGNRFHLSQNLAGGLTYFHEGYVVYQDGNGIDVPLTDISLVDIKSFPERIGFSLERARVQKQDDGAFILKLEGSPTSKVSVSCLRVAEHN